MTRIENIKGVCSYKMICDRFFFFLIIPGILQCSKSNLMRTTSGWFALSQEDIFEEGW